MNALRCILIALTPALAASTALAHEGHGLEGPHWHATDAWGFLIGVVAIGLAVWLRRK
jgi:hypothetical protein